MLCIETEQTIEKVKSLLNTCVELMSNEIASKAMDISSTQYLSDLIAKRGELVDLLGSPMHIKAIQEIPLSVDSGSYTTVPVEAVENPEDSKFFVGEDGLIYKGIGGNFTGTLIRGFRLNRDEATIKANTWKGMFRKLIEILNAKDRARFDKILEDMSTDEIPFAVRNKPTGKLAQSYEKIPFTTVYVRKVKMDVPRIISEITEILRLWDNHGAEQQYKDSICFGIVAKDQEPLMDSDAITAEVESLTEEQELVEQELEGNDEATANVVEELKAVDDDNLDEPKVLGLTEFDVPKVVCKSFAINERLPENAKLVGITVYNSRLGKKVERKTTEWRTLTLALCRVLSEMEGANAFTILVGKSLSDQTPKDKRYSPSIVPTKTLTPDISYKYLQDSSTGMSCLENNGYAAARRNCMRVIKAYGLPLEAMKLEVELY